MDTKNNIITGKKIDRFIEEGKINEAVELLNNAVDCKPQISVDKFIYNIREENKMKNKHSKRVLLAVAAVCVITCTGVCADSYLKQFTFNENGKYVSVTSNSDISKDDAQKLAKDAANSTAEPNENNTIKPDSFDTINEAEKAYDMKVALPSVIPDMELNTVEGSVNYISEDSSSSTIWAAYGDADKKAYGITVTKNNYNDKDITSVLSTDAEDTGSAFVSQKGYKFNILNESDEESNRTAKIFALNKGVYEYSIYFTGFDEAEMEDIVNSIDLAEYN